MDVRPWDRRAGESESSWGAFLVYRDLGLGRSLERVAETLAEGEHRTCTGHAPLGIDRLKKLSARNSWVDRSRAWDNHLQRERDRVAVEQAAEWERRRLAALESVWQDAERLRAKADKMLAFPLQRTVVECDDHGHETTVIHPTKWTFWTAAQMLRMAAEIQAAVLEAVSKDPADLSDAKLHAIAGEPIGPSPVVT